MSKPVMTVDQAVSRAASAARLVRNQGSSDLDKQALAVLHTEYLWLRKRAAELERALRNTERPIDRPRQVKLSAERKASL